MRSVTTKHNYHTALQHLILFSIKHPQTNPRTAQPSHAEPPNLPKSVTCPLASELVYKRLHCGKFHTCHVRRFSCEPRRRMKLATEGTRQWQPTKRTIARSWSRSIIALRSEEHTS